MAPSIRLIPLWRATVALLAFAFVATCLSSRTGESPVTLGAPNDPYSAYASATETPVRVRDLEAVCGSTNPYFFTTRFSGQYPPPEPDNWPAVIAFKDHLGDDPTARFTLATQEDVGATYGLAYDVGRRHVYVAAYHKRGAAFGPSGPGAIYRIDLATGAVATWATLEAGSDHHDFRQTQDQPARVWVGRTSLGDIELDEAGSELYVANLYDGRIHRLSVPDGNLLGSFAHGAASEPWLSSARLFGLGFYDGWLYHGVMDTTGASGISDWAVGYVYRCRPDGSDMEEVLTFDLEPRQASESTVPGYGRATRIADIEFRPNGDLIIGLRELTLDSEVSSWIFFAGMVLPTERDAQRWRLADNPFDHYDSHLGPYPDVALGGLAAMPGLDNVISSGCGLAIDDPYGYPRQPPAGALAAGRSILAPDQTRIPVSLAHWYANPTGAQLRQEVLADHHVSYPSVSTAGLGDVESLCRRDEPIDPAFSATETAEVSRALTATADAWATVRLATHTAAAATDVQRATAMVETATSAAATGVARATDVYSTATAAAATGTVAPPTPAGTPEVVATTTAVVAQATANAPTQEAIATAAATAATVGAPTAAAAKDNYDRIRASCGSADPYLVVANIVPYLDYSGIPHSDTILDAAPALIALHDTLANRMSELTTLAVEPQVGAIHGLAYDWRRGHLYAAAYLKRLARYGPYGQGAIYRQDLATGAIAPWVLMDAGPDPHNFASGFDDPAAHRIGALGIGDIELDADGKTLFAVNLYDRLIYRYAVPDGRFLAAFPHGAATKAWSADARPFGLGVRDEHLYHGVIDSRAGAGRRSQMPVAYVYRSQYDGSGMEEVLRQDMTYERTAGGYTGVYQWTSWGGGTIPSGPMFTDISFRPSGEPILGFRNRNGDGIMTVGDGDVLPTFRAGRRFFTWTYPEHYEDLIVHDESSWGSLAALPGFDVVVTTALDPITANSGGALWLSNTSGRIIGRETAYGYGQTSPTFGKSTGLGDLEVLCPPLSPTPPPTATYTPTSTPTTTPSLTPTATPTATPRPQPIYLPLTLGESCHVRQIHASVVLVIDASTSMRRATADGTPKLEAVQIAARTFVGLMDYTPNDAGRHDQVAIVGFNDTAWTLQPLTSREERLRTAIDALPDGVAQGTRLDLALEQGLEALDDPALLEDNTRVIVLLTDGLPNRVPTPTPDGRQEDTVLAVADRAKRLGVRIYTVGVGRPDAPDIADRINPSLLSQVASAPGMFYQTVDASELARIYTEIAYQIGCPPERFWPYRE